MPGNQHSFEGPILSVSPTTCELLESRNCVLFVLDDKHARFLQKSHPQKKIVNRVGISATKKLGGAVERNRAKRIIREARRSLTKQHELVVGKLIVISAREASNEAKSGDVLKDLTYAAAKIGLFSKK